MAGNSVVQRQKGLQQFQLGVAEELHVSAGFTTAEHGAKGDDQNVMQRMEPSIGRPGVLQTFEKVFPNVDHGHQSTFPSQESHCQTS